MDPKHQKRLGPGAGSENSIAKHQALHQRHKSTGNLTANDGIGGFRAAAKRTAFGDVSNTVGAAGAAGAPGHPGAGQEDGKAVGKTGFNRPAVRQASQRPLPAHAKTSASLAVKPLVSADSLKPRAGANKTASKKTTVIYKDGQPVQGGDAHSAKADNHGSVPVPAALTALPSQQPRHYRSQPVLKTDLALPAISEAHRSLAHETMESGRLEDLEEASYEDAVESPPLDEKSRLDTLPGPMAYQSTTYIPNLDINLSRNPSTSSRDPAYVFPNHDDVTQALSEDAEAEEDYYEAEQGILAEIEHNVPHTLFARRDWVAVLEPQINAGIQMELETAKAIVEHLRTDEDLMDDTWDVSMVAEYGDEIFQYMKGLEAIMKPDPHYMDHQTEIQWSMRAVLMDWLIQVHHRFCLLPETLFLTVNYIDRFLSKKVVSMGKLQLVGATAILLASKYEEINCPSLQEIYYMVDGGYKVDEIIKAERFMLSMLGFELGWPGPMSFLRRISKADDYDLDTRTMAKYFLEVTIMDERFIGCPPSFLAAGAHCMARLILRKGYWTPAHVHYSGYTMAQIRPILLLLSECCRTPYQHHGAVYEKYSDKRFKKCAEMVFREIQGGFAVPHSGPVLAPVMAHPGHYHSERYHHMNLRIPIGG